MWFTIKFQCCCQATVERRTVCDGEGEMTTVTKSLGDKTYSVTTKTNPDGSQRQTENFVNMTEGKVKITGVY